MFISSPILTKEDQEICVSADIMVENAQKSLPEKLWFKFPIEYQDYITCRSDGFLVGLLPSAMALGENVRIKGTISPRLAYGLREYQQILHAWYPEQFKIIKIQYEHLEESIRSHSQYGVGAAFSGGVDSFYTLWKHLPENEPLERYKITYCLMINGFDKDVDLNNLGTFKKLYEIYESMMDKLGITLLTSKTNLQKFRLAAMSHHDLHHSFGSALTASALVLGNLLSCFYLPASHSYAYETLVPQGAHPILDHLLGTETLQIIHDGSEASRTQKTAKIAQWNETYSRLRVCLEKAKFDEEGKIQNCGNCLKCINTMLSLDLLNVLPRYTTFPPILKHQQIWQARNLTKFRYAEHLKLAHQQGRKDRILDLYCYYLQDEIIYRNYSKVRDYFRTLYRQL